MNWTALAPFVQPVYSGRLLYLSTIKSSRVKLVNVLFVPSIKQIVPSTNWSFLSSREGESRGRDENTIHDPVGIYGGWDNVVLRAYPSWAFDTRFIMDSLRIKPSATENHLCNMRILGTNLILVNDLNRPEYKMGTRAIVPSLTCQRFIRPEYKKAHLIYQEFILYSGRFNRWQV